MVGISQLVGHDPRGPPGGDDHRARRRRAAHGAPPGRRAPARGGRDAGLDHRHLHRQDRDAHPQRDDRDRRLPARRPRARGHRRRLRARGRVPATADAAIDPRATTALRALLEAAVAVQRRPAQRPRRRRAGWRPLGDPTEVALLTLAIKGGIDPDELRGALPAARRDPVRSRRQDDGHAARRRPAARASSSRARPRSCSTCAALRRADGTVTLDDERGARRGAPSAWPRARCACSPSRSSTTPRSTATPASPPSRAARTLLGLVGQIDPPRPEVAGRRRALPRGRHPAGHGDRRPQGHRPRHRADARHRARRATRRSTGASSSRCPTPSWRERIDGISVFARVHPAQKLRIVEAYQKRGRGRGHDRRRRQRRARAGHGRRRRGHGHHRHRGGQGGREDRHRRRQLRHHRRRRRGRARRLPQHQEGHAAAVLDLGRRGRSCCCSRCCSATRRRSRRCRSSGTTSSPRASITVNLVMEPAEGDEMRRPPDPPRRAAADAHRC